MKRTLLASVMILIILTGGCWDRMEINDLALVVATGADLVENAGKDNVMVTLQIANPVALVPGQGGGWAGPGAPKAFWTITGRGVSVLEASQSVSERIPKRLFFGQSRVYVIGEEAARSGISRFLDKLLRGRSTRRNIYLVIARGTAKRVLEVEMPTFRATGLAIANIFDLEGETRGIFPVTLNDFAYRLSTGVTSPVAPVVSVVPQTSISAEDLKVPGGSPRAIRVSGLAVFDPQEGKLLGFFDEQQTLGLMWVLGKIKEREIVVSCPVEGPVEPVLLKLIRSKSRIIVHIDDNGLPSFEVRVKTLCDLSEHFGIHAGLLTIPYFESLERRVNTSIEREIGAAVSKAQALHVDVFGFGEEVKRQRRHDWRRIADRWEEIFPVVNVTIKAETGFRHRGLSVEAPGSRKEHVR